MLVSLATSPVSPEVDWAFDQAPELAWLTAPPMAVASPVRPELPVSPVFVLPSTFSVPLMAAAEPTLPLSGLPSLRVLALLATAAAWMPSAISERASPEPPVLPELPDCAVGLPIAVELALPVSPVLVADD